jgi:hypothetical protein
MRSEKSYAGGTVVMTISFDRLMSAQDALTIELYDRTGQKVRTERYTSDEVMQRARSLYDVQATVSTQVQIGPSTSPTTSPAPATQSSERALLHAALLQRIQAATQPSQP